MGILRGFLLLLLFQIAGTGLEHWLRVPVPGPVIGMVLLAVWMVLRGKGKHEDVEKTADGLLDWLPLLFVPAGVGVVTEFGLLRSAWLPVSVGLVGSTLLTLVVTAGVMELFARRGRARARRRA
jgi:holin-like protein